jgi:hypothetical protein
MNCGETIMNRWLLTRWFWGVVIALMLSGCAGHPLPDDVTRQSTLTIVKAIRCEAQAAIRQHATPTWVYEKGAIGFVFDFEILEHNKATLGFDLQKIFPSGTFTMNVPPSADLQRQGVRRFTIVDTFKDLSAADCSHAAVQASYIYPIVGSVGLDEVIRTAIGIDKLGGHVEAETIQGIQNFPGGQAAVFSDELTYTTKIDTGLINPMATFAGGAPGVLKLTSVTGGFELDRQDIHKLTVAIALPDPPPTTDKGALRTAAKSMPAQQALIMGNRGIPSKVLIHGTANPQVRVLWELDRRALLGQEDRLINALSGAIHP